MHLRPSANKHSDDEDREKSGCVYEVRPWPQTGIVSKCWHYATTYTTTSFVRALCKCLINNENPKKTKQQEKRKQYKCVIWNCLYDTRQERKVKSWAAFDVHNYFKAKLTGILCFYCITLGSSMKLTVLQVFFCFMFLRSCQNVVYFFSFQFKNFFALFARIRFNFVSALSNWKTCAKSKK